MKVVDPGHLYTLDQLDTPQVWVEQRLQFVKRCSPPEKYPGNVGHHPGTTTQEVLRVLIDRTKYVDNQQHFAENTMVLTLLRMALYQLEKRAARHRGYGLPACVNPEIENIPKCGRCGHIFCKVCK